MTACMRKSHRKASAETAAYLAHLIDEAVSSGRTITSLARVAGLSEAQVSTVRSGQRGVGPKSLVGLARAFGRRPDEIEHDALTWRSEVEPFPNRAPAVVFARACGMDEAAIQEVERYTLGADPSPEAWLDLIRAAAVAMRHSLSPMDL